MHLSAEQYARSCVSLGYSDDEILAVLRDDYPDAQAAAVLAAAKTDVLAQESELYDAQRNKEDRK